MSANVLEFGVGGERCGVGDRDGGGDGDSDSDRDSGGGPGPLAARARTESGMGQAPENREDGIEQGQGGCDGGLVHVTPSHGNGQM